jgi:hypothetical protein
LASLSDHALYAGAGAIFRWKLLCQFHELSQPVQALLTGARTDRPFKYSDIDPDELD